MVSVAVTAKLSRMLCNNIIKLNIALNRDWTNLYLITLPPPPPKQGGRVEIRLEVTSSVRNVVKQCNTVRLY